MLEQFWKRLYRHRMLTSLGLLIIIVAFCARVYRLETPPNFFFDEVYHGFTATTYLHNDPKGYEYWQTPPEGVAYEWTHPPLAKLFMALGMSIFGENSVGWRASSVFFGTGVIILTGVLCHLLFRNPRMTILAIFLASIDGLLLTMSRIAMNDMHFVFFSLAGVCLYSVILRQVIEHKISKKTSICIVLLALSLGLALASKWTTLYVILALLLHGIGTLLANKVFPVRTIIGGILVAVVIIPTVYLASYTQFFLQGHTLLQWKETTQQMWWYHTGLKATHPYESRPIQWVTNTRPVWMHVEYTPLGESGKISNIYNAGNPLIFWSGIVVAALWVTIAASRLLRKILLPKSGRGVAAILDPALFFVIWLYCMLWIPWQFSPRIMFFYHYSPAVPLLCIILAYSLERVMSRGKNGVIIGGLVLLAMVIPYVLLYPINTGLPMPQDYFDQVFRVFPSWK